MSRVTELALKMREMAREEVRSRVPGSRYFTVLDTSPLRIEDTESDLVLEEGDQDLELEQWVKHYDSLYGLVVGDTLVCHPIGTDGQGNGSWVATGVISETDVTA